MARFAPNLYCPHHLNPLFVHAVRTNRHPRYIQARIAGFSHTSNLSNLLDKDVVYLTTLMWDRLSRLADLVEFPKHLVLREGEPDGGDFDTIPEPKT